MHLAHEFLQRFCHNNENNQLILHRHLELFLQSGDNVGLLEITGGLLEFTGSILGFTRVYWLYPWNYS